MPSSRSFATRRQDSSTSARRSYLVVGEAESAARAKATDKQAKSTGPQRKAAVSKGSASNAKAKAKLRPPTTATASDWSACFSLLMHRLDPTARATIAQTAGALATEARSASRRNAFDKMGDACNAASSPRRR
jgi:hypothetical protein